MTAVEWLEMKFGKTISASDWFEKAKQMEREQMMQWIDIKDQLPNPTEYKSVLCCYKSGNVKETPTTLVEFSGYVEYWMPLPIPPSVMNEVQN